MALLENLINYMYSRAQGGALERFRILILTMKF